MWKQNTLFFAFDLEDDAVRLFWMKILQEICAVLACFQFFIWSTLQDGHLWDQKKGSVRKRCPSFIE